MPNGGLRLLVRVQLNWLFKWGLRVDVHKLSKGYSHLKFVSIIKECCLR